MNAAFLIGCAFWSWLGRSQIVITCPKHAATIVAKHPNFVHVTLGMLQRLSMRTDCKSLIQCHYNFKINDYKSRTICSIEIKQYNFVLSDLFSNSIMFLDSECWNSIITQFNEQHREYFGIILIRNPVFFLRWCGGLIILIFFFCKFMHWPL